ncbi:DNA-binding protein [Roseovarius faecimaris]|uniref:DNA-binding protein n=1 Tax=Roseovarius faecimaris TaxID=2494550 RepID=A0A6I6INT7_9RHOB|nr:helix-turn-helix domain-containing protein [Roseovarius faecimaris]QGX97471.1 DNA-binding protein [Roseovarius faecimaris]
MKRYHVRGLCKSRVYTFKMAARIVGVSLTTFRKWPKQGLPVITDKRPYLVRGADLIDFLTKRIEQNRCPMGKRQFHCMTCHAPRDAETGSLAYTTQTTRTGRLSALCGTCGGKMGRFSNPENAHQMIEADRAAINTATHAYCVTSSPVETRTFVIPVDGAFVQGGTARKSPSDRKENQCENSTQKTNA